jgi:CheY-like chemotaxis protein
MDKRDYTILVVDKNTDERAALFDFLHGLGFRVLVAETGEASVKTAARFRPDAILMDIMLPDINGFEACRQIGSNAKFKDIPPVIFMSTLAEHESKADGLKAGGSAFITKPVLHEEVASLLDIYLKLQKFEDVSTVAREREHMLSELGSMIDIVAHDIKNPLFCILALASELEDGFKEQEVPEEWVEFATLIQNSSFDIDTSLEALVLLKKLRMQQWEKNEITSLEKTITSALKRYETHESPLPIELTQTLTSVDVISQPRLLEELILILWRTLGTLNAEKNSTLPILITSGVKQSGMVILTMEAPTREITETELPHILKPMDGGKQKKVKDTKILTICAQKIIEYLAINAWAETTDAGLKISLSFPAPEDS